MKTVWLTCSVLCACAIICCIGFFTMGKNLLADSIRLEAEADAYATSTLNRVGKDWDPASLRPNLAPDAKSDVLERLEKTGKPLGALTHATPFKSVGNGFYINNGVKTSRVKTGCDATFEHGTARIELTLTNDGTGWKVQDFQFNPPPNDSGVRRV